MLLLLMGCYNMSSAVFLILNKNTKRCHLRDCIYVKNIHDENKIELRDKLQDPETYEEYADKIVACKSCGADLDQISILSYCNMGGTSTCLKVA